jgi:prolyl-tRNA synthetase
MRVTRLFGQTQRSAPSSELRSHNLLVRAGYVRQLASGIYSYLPLGQRALGKIGRILRDEMAAIGGQEVSMPVVQPAELWRETGRWDSIDEALVRFRDRRGRDMVLAMTHEEVVADLVRADVRSHHQLPQLIFQIQTKFRDEPRSRGGLIRTREFLMKDSYSLDRDVQGMERQYAAHYAVYVRIGTRVGLELKAVLSDTGMMGGRTAHEFMYITPVGEDTLVLCSGCDYAANLEAAQFTRDAPAGGEQAPAEEVHTPGVETIDGLAAFLGIGRAETAKSVFFAGDFGDNGQMPIVAVVRGDMDVNPTLVLNLSGASALRPATEEEIESIGAFPGYGSPVGIDKERAVVVVDVAVAAAPGLVMGANRRDTHLLNARYGRDYEPKLIGEIAQAFEGAGCVACGRPLTLTRGVEVGNIFQLMTRYSDAMGVTYTDEDGHERPVVMGSYGIGLGRLLACVAEEHNDEQGLCLPISVAPFEVTLLSLGKNEDTLKAADEVYRQLCCAGVEVLYDDRTASAGVKFADADLRGIPLRLTVSDRTVKEGAVELKWRARADVSLLPIEDTPRRVQGEINALARLPAQPERDSSALAGP